MIGIGVPIGIGKLANITPAVKYAGIINGDISDNLDTANIDDQNLYFGITASASF